MINILCYGDSNTWGNIAGTRNIELMLVKRYKIGVRWTSVLQKLLGSNYNVIEAGLNGRNTSFDETKVVRPSRNGSATLPLIMEMNYPLDLVILMLGTNDAIIDYNATPEFTTLAIQKMIHYIKNSHFGNNFSAPQVLLMAPAPINKVDSVEFNMYFNNESINKTERLALLYKDLALKENCHFLDIAPIVKVSQIDGVHLEADSHTNLAQAIANKINKINF